MRALTIASPRPKTVQAAPAAARHIAALDELPALVARLVETGTPGEIVQARHDAEALRRVAESARLGMDAQNVAAEARFRLERRLGEMLAGRVREGRPKKVVSLDSFRLAYLGIGRDLSARAQRIASIAPARFERFFMEARHYGWEVTNATFFYRIESDAVGELARQRAAVAERFPHRRQRRAASDISAPGMPSRATLLQGDCLDLMARISDRSVDMILTDLPWGSTYGRILWDRELNLDRLWQHYRRIIKPNAAIILLAKQPYASRLVASQLDLFKYEVIWRKNNHTDFAHAKHRPLRVHENVLVFSEGGIGCRSKAHMPYYPDGHHLDGCPLSVIEFPPDRERYHPMQKPVALLRWLIHLHTQPGETVLDSCMGSGSTGVAARECGRDFIGIELYEPHFEIATHRIGC